jgi:hypothetical protein
MKKLFIYRKLRYSALDGETGVKEGDENAKSNNP